jgi:UDP-N-acetylmuramate dehydrogenase
LGLGGGASEWIVAETEAELIEACAEAENLFILGGGSNIVVADGGFPGTVVQVKTHGIERRKDGEFVTLRVQAGETWDQVVEMSVEKSLAGLECMSGIPGTAGAAPIQNIGAYGPELEEVVAMVKVYDRASGEVLELDCEECEFDYRTSRFKKDDGRYVVLSVDLRLKRQEMSLPITYPELAEALGVSPGGSAPLSTVRSTVLGLRAKRGMVLDPDDRDTYSTGSFFMNPLVSAGHLAEVQLRAEQICGGPVDVPHELEGKDYASLRAGWLIEKAGIPKGYGNPGQALLSADEPRRGEHHRTCGFGGRYRFPRKGFMGRYPGSRASLRRPRLATVGRHLASTTRRVSALMQASLLRDLGFSKRATELLEELLP